MTWLDCGGQKSQQAVEVAKALASTLRRRSLIF